MGSEMCIRDRRHPALARPEGLDRLWLRSWRHLGVGPADGSQAGPYRSWRSRRRVRGEELPEGLPDPADGWVATLAPGVECRVPLALYVDGEGTLPRGEGPAGEPADDALPAITGRLTSEWTGADRATRLAAVALGWNVFQHFYPYFDVVAVDWEGELARALDAAAVDPDEHAFLETLKRLVAALGDGHGSVYYPNAEALGVLPLAWDWIEGALVVTALASDSGLDLAPGDRVVALDGVAAADALDAAEELVSGATPQWKRWVALQTLTTGKYGAPVELQVERGGGEHAVEAEYGSPSEPVAEPRPEVIAELEDGIWYVDLGRVGTDAFLEALESLEGARGIVFDMRGYPSGLDSHRFFPHLIEEPVHSAWWNVPVATRPDRAGVEWSDSRWTIQPGEPHLTAPKAFLTDGRAISYAESCMGIVEHYRLGEIVGGPTAGTNGNVNPFSLPGGYQVSWTGMRVLKHDRSPHHGVGILPTVPVARTRAGVAAGRDEVLEAALQVLREE